MSEARPVAVPVERRRKRRGDEEGEPDGAQPSVEELHPDEGQQDRGPDGRPVRDQRRHGVADAAHPAVRPVDAVLLDAPCLGTGTFARHPEARLRVTAQALRDLAATQAQLLAGVAAAVRPGGLLVYATCSLEPEENEEQVTHFLDHHPAFRREASSAVPAECLTAAGDLTLLPHRHGTDGAYAARLRRTS